MLSNEIKYLLAIKNTNNISKAAELLNISQPSLSRYLKDKEKEIGHEIFKRESGKINGISDFGKIYFFYAQKMADIENVYQKDKMQFEKRGKEITLAIPMPLINNISMYIYDLRRNNPDIDITIVTDYLKQIKEKLTNQEYDYAILAYDQKREGEESVFEINITTLIPTSIQNKYKDKAWVDEMGRQHIDIHELKDEVFYLPSKDKLIGKVAYDIMEKYNFKPKEIVE